MQKLKIVDNLGMFFLVVVGVVIVFWYQFLWPVLLFAALGQVRSRKAK